MSLEACVQFEVRALTLAKDAEHPEQNQDAWQADADRGIAALGDGVATGLFSRRWAQILVEAAVCQPADLVDTTSFAAWLAERRAQWHAEIDPSNLTWFQKPKLREGAFSTLLCAQVSSLGTSDAGSDTARQLRATAVGDSCLFLVRDGSVRRVFPLETSQQFDADPLVIGSQDLKRDALLRFAFFEETCWPGDLVVLATDAVALWAIQLLETGDQPPWESFFSMREEAWRDRVATLRSRGELRYDDTTIVLLRIQPCVRT